MICVISFVHVMFDKVLVFINFKCWEVLNLMFSFHFPSIIYTFDLGFDNKYIFKSPFWFQKIFFQFP